MGKITAVIAAVLVGLGLSLAVVGCGAPTASKDKMSDKMKDDKMKDDKMKDDKMKDDKMKDDKMKDK